MPGVGYGSCPTMSTLTSSRAGAGRRAARGPPRADSPAPRRPRRAGAPRARRCRERRARARAPSPHRSGPSRRARQRAHARAHARAPSDGILCETEPFHDHGKSIHSVGLAPRVVGHRDRTGLGVDRDRAHVRAAIAAAARPRARGSGRCRRRRRRAARGARRGTPCRARAAGLPAHPGRCRAGVELDVQGAAVLRAEGVGHRAAGQQPPRAIATTTSGTKPSATIVRARSRDTPRRNRPTTGARAPPCVHSCASRHSRLAVVRLSSGSREAGHHTPPRTRSGPRARRCWADCATGRIVTGRG